MWFLYLLSWIALIIQVCLVTLSVAAGLYYLAELVEEYTVMAARVIRYLITITSAVLVLMLLFEDLPISLIVCSLCGNLAYYLVLKSFPYFDVASPAFIASIVLLMLNHYLAFSYFSTVWHPFSEVLAFFTICLWVVPFVFFVSLSANEYTLPTHAEAQPHTQDESDVVSNYFRKKGKKYGLLSFFKYAQDSVLPQRVKKQF